MVMNTLWNKRQENGFHVKIEPESGKIKREGTTS